MFISESAPSGGLSSVDGQHLPGDVIRSVRRKEHRSAFQIVIATKPAQGSAREKVIAVAFNHDRRHICGEPAGRDRVHLDVVHSPFASEIPSESDYAAFACVISDSLKLWWSPA